MDDLARFCCQNSECPDYGKRGGENLSVCGCYGRNKQWRMLRCRTCKARFSERKGTPLFGSALSEEKVRSILAHIAEGCGVRETGRLVGVHRDTVMRWATTPARCMTNSWPFPPNTREVQFDEKWSFVGKKEKHCDPADPHDAKQGDNWDHLALDAEHRLVVSVVPGKRTVGNVEALVQDFKERTEGRPMNLITSDEYKPYRQAILQAYGREIVPERTGKSGRPKAPYYEPSPALRYATVHKTREKGRVAKFSPSDTGCLTYLDCRRFAALLVTQSRPKLTPLAIDCRPFRAAGNSRWWLRVIPVASS